MLPHPTPQSPTHSSNLLRKPSIVSILTKKTGPPSCLFSTHHSKPLSQTKKSQSRNSRPLRSLPQSPLFLPQLQKAPSFRHPPLPYSLLSSPPSYVHTSPSTSPPSSPPIMRQIFTHIFSVPRPTRRTPTTTPTSIPFLFRMVRMFGLHKRNSPTRTFYVSSLASKTSQRHSPISSPPSGLKSFIWSLYHQWAPFPPSSYAPK